MQIKRELEFTLSASRRFIIRQLRPDVSLSPCAQCGEPLVAAEQAANLLGVSHRRIFQIIETDGVHFTETEAGTTLICIASMSDIDHNTARRSEELK